MGRPPTEAPAPLLSWSSELGYAEFLLNRSEGDRGFLRYRQVCVGWMTLARLESKTEFLRYRPDCGSNHAESTRKRRARTWRDGAFNFWAL